MPAQAKSHQTTTTCPTNTQEGWYHIILPTDKGDATVVMERVVYEEKVEAVVNDWT